jgi:hypothetical protein
MARGRQTPRQAAGFRNHHDRTFRRDDARSTYCLHAKLASAVITTPAAWSLQQSIFAALTTDAALTALLAADPKRNDLIAATMAELDKVADMVTSGRLRGRDKIGVRVGSVVNKYKVAKHFGLAIADAAFSYRLKSEQVAAEAALDGLYVIRTSVADGDMSAEAAALNYKRLAEVERGFRTLKGIDLSLRPIRHRLEDRVRAHILLSMLAYYVEWHMIQAWAPLTFKDEAQDKTGTDAARERDPVTPARRSAAALAKARTRRLADGTPAMSFTRLLAHMGSIVRNTMRSAGARIGEATFTLTTRPTPKQQQALDLLATIAV